MSRPIWWVICIKDEFVLYFEIEFLTASPEWANGLTPVSGGVRFSFEGRSGRWLIGRADEADIAYTQDRRVSRKAAFLEADAGALFIVPVSQNSPTCVDGVQVTARAKLRVGNTVDIGSQRLRIAAIDTRRPAGNTGFDNAERTTIMTRSSVAAPVRAGPARIEITQTSRLIGRGTDSGMVTLAHPTVSRVHAEVRSRGGKAFIRDRGSVNGTFVNGKRLSGARELSDGDAVSIGPFAFEFDRGALVAVQFDESAPIIEAAGLTVDVKDRQTGKPLRILDDVSLKINKGELVCLVGSSGSGKSTLVNLLSARTQPTAGSVRMKGADLLTNFAALKNKMSYVPQNNALHETLTLQQALGFAAKLRLEKDLTADARAGIVKNAAASVDLGERLDVKIDVLSGGQKKRASLASEMLASPEVLFLDEVTSGLDEATDREIMALMRKRADAGMTIVCVTHTLANVLTFCDKLVVMGNGGIPTFVGPPREALTFFGVESLGDIFDALDESGPERWRTLARQRLAAFQEAPLSGADRAVDAKLALPRPQTNYTGILRQLGILTHRNALLTLADTKFLIMAFIQSVMIGAMLGYAYSEFGDEGQEITSRIALLMALGTSALWLGTNTAASNIVGEALIFQRERDVNVSTVAFVVSKFLVSGVFSVVQVTILVFLAAWLAEEMPGNTALQWGFMVIGALIGVGMGLSISAFSNTQEQANAIVPLALIPQLILAGVLVPALPELGVWFSKLTISAFWLTEGMTDIYIRFADEVPTQLNLTTGAQEELEAESATLAVAMLLVHLVVTVFSAVGLALLRFNKR